MRIKTSGRSSIIFGVGVALVVVVVIVAVRRESGGSESIGSDRSTVPTSAQAGGDAREVRVASPVDAHSPLVTQECVASDGAIGCFPTSISGNKILDQRGQVFLMRSFSSWTMASHLSNGEITLALEGVQARGFNAVTVWVGGGYHLDDSWYPYTNVVGKPFWNGAPWRSTLGPAWSSVDWVVRETGRLGLVANLSFCGGYEDTGARPDWEASSDAEMYDVGAEIARRYLDSDNIVWHVMFDSDHTPGTVAGGRIDALFHGINDVEGPARRPIRWAEPLGATINSQFFTDVPFEHVNLTLNGIYDYGANATELIEQAWAEDGAASFPLGDTEPPYDGSPYYGEQMGQQLRERSFAVFLEGGSFINYGHEDWWSFGLPALFSEGLAWRDVPTHVHTLEQSYVWALVDAYVADPTWRPDDGAVLVDGERSGDEKAAAGRSTSAAIVYLPTAREITIDTTVFEDTSRVRLRWFDPTTGSFTTIAASEPVTVERRIDATPPDHEDGTSDWVLVVDAA